QMQGLSPISPIPWSRSRNVRLLPESRSLAPPAPPACVAFYWSKAGARDPGPWAPEGQELVTACPPPARLLQEHFSRDRWFPSPRNTGRRLCVAFIPPVPQSGHPDGGPRRVQPVRTVRAVVGTGAARHGGVFRAAGAGAAVGQAHRG